MRAQTKEENDNNKKKKKPSSERELKLREKKKSNNFTIMNNKHEIIRTFKSYQYTPKNMSCKEKHTQDNHDFKVMNMWQILCRNGNKYMRQYSQKQYVWGNQNVKVIIRYPRKRAEIKTFFFLCSHWNRTLIRNLKHDILRNLYVSICTKDCALYQKRKLNNSYVIFRNSKQYKKRKQ